MFSECFDFAPAPARNSRKAATYLPSVAPAAPQLTPKEQANKLADTVGIDQALLDGISLDMLHSANAKTIKFAMHCAAAALQTGQGVAEFGGDALAEFLKAKIGMLPLATRFPLMEEWSGKEGYAAYQPTTRRSQALPAGGAAFLSFDDGESSSRAGAGPVVDPLASKAGPPRRESRPGTASKQPRESPAQTGPSKQELRRRNQEAAASQAAADAAARILPHSLGDVIVHEPPPRPLRPPSPELPRPVPPPGAIAGVRVETPTTRHARNVARAFLEDIEVDKDTQSTAARREQDAKNLGSNALKNFERTCAAVEAGIQAAKRTKELSQAFQLQNEDAAAKEVRAEAGSSVGSAAREPRDGSPSASHRRDRGTAQDQGGLRSRSRDSGARFDGRRSRLRYNDERDNDASERDGRGGRAQERDDSRSWSLDSRADADPNRYRSRRAPTDSRSCSRRRSRRPRQAAPGRRPGDGGEAGDGAGRRGAGARSRSRRRRAFAQEPPRVAPDGQPKISASDFDKKRPFSETKASGRLFTETVGAKPSALAAAPVAGAPEKPAVVSEAPPVLRQLACRNGWAEYVDQNTGQHVFKNVLTGEMTKTKPKEYDALISDQANQRRLAWLANHAAMRSMGLM